MDLDDVIEQCDKESRLLKRLGEEKSEQIVKWVELGKIPLGVIRG